MATIKTSDADAKLFAPTDPYFYTVDNRPLRELITNDQAVNAQVEDIVESDCELIQVVMETPTAPEDFIGGPHCVRDIGEIVRVAVSVGTAGNADAFLVDVKVDNVTIFTTPANKPVLSFDDPDKLAIVSEGSIENGNVPENGVLTIHLEAVQGGTPRWLRVAVWVRKVQSGYDAGDY